LSDASFATAFLNNPQHFQPQHVHPLHAYGWTPDLDELFQPLADAGLVLGRIVRVDRGRCDVVIADGDGVATVLADTGPVTTGDPMKVPCTGDWAALSVTAAGTYLQSTLPRRTSVVRSTSSQRSEGQVLAVNVDTVVIAASLADVPDLGRIERFLALAWESGAQPLIVLTKADLAGDADHIREDVETIAPGVDVLVVSAATGRGMDVLAACLPGTSALVGQSGAGKSTIANALLGSEVMTVQPTRKGDNKGRHTTTTREMMPLPGGGVLIDTPGLRGVGMFDSAQGVQQVFSEIEELAEDCRFGDCGHTSEPGCAVLEALADGVLTERRLDSYRKLLRENEWIASRTDARLRAERLKHWKTVSKAGTEAMKAKGRH
jgi:ribosome biogenesis GTPase